jgi:hypothetical protein
MRFRLDSAVGSVRTIRTVCTHGVFGIAAAVTVAVLAAPGCSQTGVGDPCIPEQEYDPGFNGFNKEEVNVESKSFQCQTRLCLVNHFQGRVSCPYGQKPDGKAPTGNGTSACVIPGTKDGKVEGNPQDQKLQKTVQAQCIDRAADKAVYCSCRCANVDGKTDDGANYCSCPDGYSCEQLVGSIGSQFSEGLTGAYCVKNGTKYTRGNNCAQQCSKGVRDCD